jgi:predicted dehydrogenase
MTTAGRPDVRWGIVGAGHAARAFASDIARTAGNRLETIAARDPARAEVVRAAASGRRVSPSYQALFEDPDVDVVYIATVNSAHHEHALRALNAGGNVLVEKPLAVSAAQAREVAQAAQAGGTFCMEGMWMRMHPLIRRAQELIHSNGAGDLLSIRADLSSAHAYVPSGRLYDPCLGGGVLLDLGVYPAHFAWSLLGAPQTVTAGQTFAPSGVADSVTMNWAYPGGQTAQLSSSFRVSSSCAIISGTSGTLHLGPRLNRPRWLRWQAGPSPVVTETDESPGNGFGPEIAEVARCLHLGLSQSPLAPLKDTLGVLGLLDHIRDSESPEAPV